MNTPSRRQMALGAALIPMLSGRAHAQGKSAPVSLTEAAKQMWIYTLPLIEVARTRQTPPAGMPPGIPVPVVNRLLHAAVLQGPANRAITTPNCDTLYSQAWVDLSAGSVKLTLPASGDRYQSIACMDMYTNNFAVVDMADFGGKGGTITISPPSEPKPQPWVKNVYRSETPWVWVLCRTLVTGPSDMAAARAVQQQIKLEAPARPPAARPAPGIDRAAPWDTYFTAAQGLLHENPPPADQADILTRCAALGLAPDKPFNPSSFTPAQAAQIAAGVQQAQAALKAAVDKSAGLTADFGKDYMLRAVIALSGLAALPSSQAVYVRVPPLTGLAGGNSYRLSFTKAQLPPAHAFWSVSMYEVTPEKQLYFRENPIHRYAIGDRTPGLKWRPDGGLDIWISATDPGGDKTSNWLPCPTSGPFAMILRGYLPYGAMSAGTYKAPAAVQI